MIKKNNIPNIKTCFRTAGFFFLLLAFNICRADVVLPSLLTNHAVLQQKSKVKLWGKAKKSTILSIKTSWDGKKYETKADKQGNFSATVNTPVAGGPYSISFNDGKEKRLENILIGEVWVCSGQSNMAMTMAGFKNQPILNADDVIKTSGNKQIRIFTVNKKVSDIPLEECGGIWQQSSPESVINTSALAYQFARLIQDSLKVPVGIIVSAWGGTPIRAWMSEESLAGFKNAKQAISKQAPQNPSKLFNAMIMPLTKYVIKGFLWYQGENDRQRAEMYRRMMPAMVDDWRTKFNNPNSPFYFVEIAPWLYADDKEVAVTYFREMQLSLSKSIKNSGIAITADIGSDKSIHPENKTTIAERLGKMALVKNYGFSEISYANPEVDKVKTLDEKILITFKYAKNGLILKDEETINFEIAGKDKIFYPAVCEITREGISVWSKEVSDPVSVRYGFKNYFKGNLFTKEGLPVAGFRTDDW